MSALAEPGPAIGYAYNVPTPPPPAAVAALLAQAERMRQESGAGARAAPVAEPTPAEAPEGGRLFTRSDARAIQQAADKYQRASEAHAQAAEGLERARKEAAGTPPPPTLPEVARAAALAYLERPATAALPKPAKPEPTPEDASAKARRAAEARGVIDELRRIIAERTEAVAVARGELRVAIIRATEAARKRAAAKWHAIALQVADVAGELDGLD
ncbi:MAG TPA: hypothetical protein VK955_06555, partial [Xanthobacteraceae bacterium]|nr:hypothetical protein [Xanthobacteraceae bacterium]